MPTQLKEKKPRKVSAQSLKPLRVAWRETRGVVLEELAEAVGRSLEDVRRALYGKAGKPLTTDEAEKIKAIIRAHGGTV